MNDLLIGFCLGIIASVIAALLLAYVDNRVIAKYKFRKIVGSYRHENGNVELKHLSGADFQARGKEHAGGQWISKVKYIGNSVFVGVYDWNPGREHEEDWGEHYLHLLPNGNISVIWINKSVDRELKGRLIWTKQ